MLHRLAGCRSLRKVSAALRHCRQRVNSTTEYRVYNRRLMMRGNIEPDALNIGKDRWTDLEAFDESAGWVSRHVFLSDAAVRLAAGEHVYTIVENNRLIHYGWTAAPVERRYIPEVGLTAELGRHSAYLYDFFTHPQHRGQGFYQINLRRIIRDLESDSRLQSAFIIVSANNSASRRAIEKMAFMYEYSLLQEWSWNRVQRWATATNPVHEAQ